MLGMLAAVLMVCSGLEAREIEACWGYLYQPNFCQDAPLCGPAQAYFPQPGDIVLVTDQSIFFRTFHKLAGADGIHHSGIVFAFPDGHMGILEAGPHNTLHVRTLDVFDHLRSHEVKHDKVWIRRRCEPLTCEQSKCLTHFVMRQDGKPFAVGRLMCQLTPFRPRGPMTQWRGGPHGERRSYFCSELVTECCVACGLLDPARCRPAATYPVDLYYGDSHNRFLHDHLDINCCWLPPARWTSCPLTPVLEPRQLIPSPEEDIPGQPRERKNAGAPRISP